MIGNDLTSRVLENGLEASSMRQRLLSHNIANINTPGFKRSWVEFERQLATALRSGNDPGSLGEKTDPGSIKAVAVTEQATRGSEDGNNVDLEGEMTVLAQNQIWYAALTRQLSDNFARLRMVIHDGRR